jgi:hypothetical protein
MNINHRRPLALAVLFLGLTFAGPAIAADSWPSGAGDCAGLLLDSIALDTTGLPYAARPDCVAATPYDNSSPPGPIGLPEHVEVSFGGSAPDGENPGAPVLYIIPVDAYEALWADTGNPGVSRAVQHLHDLLASRPEPIPTSGMPVLPFERVTGFNDLAVLGQYLDNAYLSGVRFVGRLSQSANPVTNVGLQYFLQGFSADGRYLIAFFHPVATDTLPADAADLPSEELQRVASDPTAYMQEKAAQLGALAPEEWCPDLAVLDALVNSLRFDLTGAETSPQGAARRLGDRSNADTSPKPGVADRSSSAETEKGDSSLDV